MLRYEPEDLIGCYFMFALFWGMSRIRDHLLFWTAYVFFKTYLNVSARPDMPLSDYGFIFLAQVTFLLVKLPLVYSCFAILDAYLESRWKLWTAFGGLALGFALAALGMSTLNHVIVLPLLLKQHSDSSIFSVPSLIYHVFTLAFVVGVAISLRLFRRQYQSRLREAELQKQKTEAELKYLKGQINPHFLFNTLNNIYSLARKGSEQTSDAIMKLSKLMRFTLYEAGRPVISLSEELKLIQDYITLEKLRYTDRLEVKYREQIDNPQQPIAPMLLIHFVENAFKHGASESSAKSFIHIDVQLKAGVLTASVLNSKGNDQTRSEGNAIGMTNIKRQLELLYPRHALTILDEAEQFTASLTIPLGGHD